MVSINQLLMCLMCVPSCRLRVCKSLVLPTDAAGGTLYQLNIKYQQITLLLSRYIICERALPKILTVYVLRGACAWLVHYKETIPCADEQMNPTQHLLVLTIYCADVQRQ